MGELLYQWSTAAQFVSVLMIALFYATIARSVKRAEVVWWAQAWFCNLVAMAVAASYWFFVPPGVVAPILRTSYVGGKVAAALLLVQGAVAMVSPGRQWLSRRTLGISVAVSVLVGIVFLTTIPRLGLAVQGGMGLLFIGCGVHVLRAKRGFTTWLGTGFLLRGALGLIEAGFYFAAALPEGVLSSTQLQFVQNILGAHSSIDLAGEWLLALGGVLAITLRTQTEMEATNGDLLSAQEELRRLADRDPLTGLANRRALPEAFRAVHDEGAAIVFFDLDGFKGVNDTYGHAAGDQLLRRFADALRACFRPGDAIVRYAGDEFVVVAIGMSPEMATERMEQLRATIDIAFSAGVAELKPGGDAEVALEAADEAMYAAKGAGV
jgi:diguanylate cyclase (GGDEF)-like protein